MVTISIKELVQASIIAKPSSLSFSASLTASSSASDRLRFRVLVRGSLTGLSTAAVGFIAINL